MTDSPAPSDRRVSRRMLLTGIAAGLGGAAVGVAGATAVAAAGGSEPTPQPTAPDPLGAGAVGSAVEPFHGPHQAGVATPAQAHAVFLALDLRPGTDKDGLRRLMRLLSDDAERLTQGHGALGDNEPELALDPARLTITFGLGPAVFDLAGLQDQRPPGFAPLPSFGIDRLQPRWSGGDVLVQVGSDDPTTLAHAVRMLGKDARAFTVPRWRQHGFLRAAGATAAGTTPRNLMGQVDGTVNPRPGTEEFDQLVWAHSGPEWFLGGSTVVVRRIRMDLETWDAFDRSGREQAIGRRLDNGAPLTGTKEADVADLDAVDERGLSVILPSAHIRRARGEASGPPFLRRGYNYDEGTDAEGASDAGLIFASYQADIERQFLPVQRRLAELDLLNTWTTPIGSAVFALPPGASPGGYVGDGLLG
ncbi:MAG: Dyp-type peroxidase [Candidatus Nanopelagicales bacterium]